MPEGLDVLDAPKDPSAGSVVGAAPAAEAGAKPTLVLAPGQTSGVDQPMSSIRRAAVCSARRTSP